jgi:hypothetical protein
MLNSSTCLMRPEPTVLGSAATLDVNDVTASAAITTARSTVRPLAFMGAPFQPARLLAISVARAGYVFVKSRLIQARRACGGCGILMGGRKIGVSAAGPSLEDPDSEVGVLRFEPRVYFSLQLRV